MTHILCRFIGHRRSKRWARPTPEGWRSECRRCGESLIRIGPKQWLPLSPEED
jgi:hypothetical protein